MDEERQENPDSENTEGGESVDTDNNDASEQESSSEDFKQLYENQKKRAEKAERRAKELEAAGTDTSRQTESDASNQSEQNTKAESSTPKQDALSREEAILFAKGHSEEEVEFAHKVSQLEGISLREATENDIFTTWKSKKEQEDKQQEAQLGASRGSGGQKKAKKPSDPGLTREEHRKIWRPIG